MYRTAEGRQSRRKGSHRSVPDSNDKGHLLIDVSAETSETSAYCAVSFEVAPVLYFEELSSLVDLENPAIASNNAAGVVMDRVQKRLIHKHIKNGRLISAVGRRDQLAGEANQRRVRNRLSFAGRAA